MATRIVFGDISDNILYSTSTTYETARAMTSPTLGTVNWPYNYEGSARFSQIFVSGVDYYVSQTFSAFDTSEITGPSSAVLEYYLSSDQTTVDFTVEVRMHDWGTTVDTGDAVAGTDLDSKTLVAQISTGSWSPVSGYKTITDVALLSNLNLSGFTRYLLSGSRQRLGNAPSGSTEWIIFYMADVVGNSAQGPPKLTIVDTSTQSSQTLSGGATSFQPIALGTHDLDLWGAGGRPVLASNQERGAGGSSCSFAQFNVASLAPITVQVGDTNSTADTMGSNTWFNSAESPDPKARGGGPIGDGAVGDSRGRICFPGGNGAVAQGGGGARGGSGGGGSAGISGQGFNGQQGSGSTGGAGGTPGAGGGAYGGAGGDADLPGESGFVPGGGAGGGGRNADAGNGGAGKMNVYWYGEPPRRRVVLFG